MTITLFLPGSSPTHDLRQRDGFESFEKAKRRRDQHIRALEAANDRACTLLARKLKRCKKGKRCGSGACAVCVRFGRVWYGNAAADALDGLSLLAVTIALVYRLRLVGHRIGAYAARATGESCSSRMAAGGLKPCRSISQVAL
jgi:hypothetical protein